MLEDAGRTQAIARRSTRLLALAGTAATLLASTSTVALAQDRPASEDTSAATEPAAEPDIVVTGSRVIRDAYDSPTPVTLVRTEDLQKTAPTSLPDALNRLPAFNNSSTPANNSQHEIAVPTHGNLLNIRGLGPERTLVLLDGIRVPSTTFTGVVNVDVLPQLLVDRVDVVTAGASAVYGSDAIAGVVNYIIDDRFEGLRGVAQGGISSRGDAANFRIGAAFGRDLSDRAHILLSLEHFENDGLLKSDRFKNEAKRTGAAVGSTGIGAPGSATNPYQFVENVRWNIASNGGLAVSGPFAGTVFTSPGTFRPAVTGTPTGSPGYFVGGDFFAFYNREGLISPLNNTQAFGRLTYDVSDETKARIQGIYSTSSTNYPANGTYLFGQQIYASNPFLPRALRDQLIAANLPSFGLSKFLAEFGPLEAHEDTTFLMASAGLEGKLDRFKWSLNYDFGRAEHDARQGNTLLLREAAAAIDAVDTGEFAGGPPSGQIVCRVTLTNPGLYPGCTPLNLFGEGAASQAAQDYVTDVSRYNAVNTQHEITGEVSGDLFDPFGAGPLTLAVGAQYRVEKLNLTSNANPGIPIPITGLRGIAATAPRFYYTNVTEAHGKKNVVEGFAEFSLPVLKDRPAFQSLDVNGAVRVTDYSTSGTVVTWKGGAAWRPISALLVRSTLSRDIRAPSLFQLFSGATAAVSAVGDPHTGISGPYNQIRGSNSGLDPEIGKTFTAGVVLQPASRASISVDYFTTKLTKAIATLSALDILNSCEISNGTAPACDLVSRPLPFSDKSPANFPTEIRVAPVNTASVKLSGVDVDATWRLDLGRGELTARLFATYLTKLVTRQSAANPAIDIVGTSGGNITLTGLATPRLRARLGLTYDAGPLSLYVEEQAISRLRFGDNVTVFYDEPRTPWYFYTNATASYTRKIGTADVQFFVTVQNLFDRAPPYAPGTIPGSTPPTVYSVYDIVGRTFIGGVRFKL